MKPNKGKNTPSIFRNLLWAAGLIVIILLVIQLILTIGTRHFDKREVPDFKGLPIKQAIELAKLEGLVPEINDSVYIKRVRKGSVINQNPAPGSKVKKGRRILLTINATTVQKAPMPNLVGYSLRSAKAELTSRGFELGRLIYHPDMATDNVLAQLCNGVDVQPGSIISCESVIDLVLGLNTNDALITTPVLAGLKYQEAIDMLHENSLNLGTLSFDGDIFTYQDSLNARVWSQYPEEYTPGLTPGRNVSIKLTLDESKIEGARHRRDYLKSVRAREILESELEENIKQDTEE